MCVWKALIHGLFRQREQSAQVNEAIDAFKRLGKVNMSLTEAVDFAIEHSRPDAVVISVSAGPEWNPWPNDL
jgi:hypothetical protein